MLRDAASFAGSHRRLPQGVQQGGLTKHTNQGQPSSMMAEVRLLKTGRLTDFTLTARMWYTSCILL